MPYDSKTGKHYDYTDKGIEQYEKDTGKGMPMKNMEYWKNKNTLSIPGVDPAVIDVSSSDKNLPDGRSSSAPFQKKK